MRTYGAGSTGWCCSVTPPAGPARPRWAPSLLTVPILSSASGLPGSQISPLVGGVISSNEAPDPELIKFLSIQGILTSLPDLLALLIALPGLQVHGDYYAPKPEFGGRSGIQVGCDIVKDFRR
jgi:hypothetical protein